MKELTKERILGALGLTARTSPMVSVLGGLGLFTLGMIIGAGVGLFTAPRPGRELREDLRSRMARPPGRSTGYETEARP